MQSKKIAILGARNIGTSIAQGITRSGKYKPEQIVLTRRKVETLKQFKEQGIEGYLTKDKI